ncbi:SH3-like domain-containing protein [Trichococcus collinsii]|uniref:SH3-like domain-containing protein n=1 Tax=Trichococcus collinsii TaxID=157076 RepID=A0AB38A0R8_9LACT|nr:SH3-like domain-containing protein [Trichococcus collinsii]CZQ90997.1 Hypothetical protein Tcol_1057 [Trichococcus collinsii]SEA53412.1 SH3-like domain-containing protein [Trichococcus collinsii]
MNTFTRKIKSKSYTWTFLVAAVIALGTATAPTVAAEETGTETYVQILSTQEVSYTAIVTRGTDAINTKPWGTAEFQTVGSSQTYLGTEVTVTQEQVADNGVTWALISKDGQEIGWIAKGALTVQNYSKITSETAVNYAAMISRGTDAINTAPWGAKGYQTIGSSADYVGKIVDVSKEQVMDYGVTWAQISSNGSALGWIAKDALKVQTYAQITKETVVDYPATISRGTDAINTAPWGARGYQTIGSSADYVGKTVDVTIEQVTDYGVTWAQISSNGAVLGWIAKDALKVQTYAQIIKETLVDYPATISRGTDAINTAPWGAKGYQTVGSSAGYVGKTVEVTKEQVMDYGVTWAQMSLNGEVLGWIAKDALTQGSYSQVTSTTEVDYVALIVRGTDAINTQPWGVKGFRTLGLSANYLGKTVTVSQEKVMDYGVTWALISLDGKELGWIAKAALQKDFGGIATQFGSAWQSLSTNIQLTAQISYATYINGTRAKAASDKISGYLQSTTSGHRIELAVSQTGDGLWSNLSFNEKDLNPGETYQIRAVVDGASEQLWTDKSISQNTILGKLYSDGQRLFYKRDWTQTNQLTLKHLLQTALEPLGSTLYVWGGGWNEADNGSGVEAITMGINPQWHSFFQRYGSNYNYTNTLYQIHNGLDCSGFIGWTIYNTVNSENNKDGYVLYADQMSKEFADRGWGAYTYRNQISGYKPGDILSSSGHVYMVLGTASDGSLVIIHSSPAGVQINGTPTPSGVVNSKAVQLASWYMSTCYPEWYKKFPNTKADYSYLTQFDKMSWDVSGNALLNDPDGIKNMSAEQVLVTLFGR